VAFADAAVGVPEIAPVVLLKLSPAGRAGLIDHEVTVPVTVGVSAAMAVPTVADMLVCG
jgi:hypothetical protein